MREEKNTNGRKAKRLSDTSRKSKLRQKAY